jgi:hypothetical protein
MKKITPTALVCSLFISLAFFPLTALAQTTEALYDTDNLPKPSSTYDLSTSTVKVTGEDAVSTTSVNGNVNAAGSQLEITNPISGDLLVAGGRVEISSKVNQNIIAAGGAVAINGDVYGDLLVAGGVVIVNGDVWGDVRVFGGEVYINSSMIGGDLLVYGGSVYEYKNTDVWGDTSLNGNKDSTSVHTGVIDPVTSLDDENLPYYVNSFSASSNTTDNTASTVLSSVFSSVCGIVWLLGGIIAAYVIIKLFPVYTFSTVETMRTKPLIAILIGAVTFFVGGILGLILLVSIIGLPLLGVLATIAILATILSGVFARYLIGKLVLSGTFKVKHEHRILSILAGYILVGGLIWLIELLPVVGATISFFISTILFYWGIGAMVLNKFKALK